MAKPSGEWLEDDLAGYGAMGITHIVSLLTRDEARELDLRHEASACAQNQIEFLQLSIEDRGLPDKAAFSELAQTVKGGIEIGHSIAIHCRAGIGRSGVLACCALGHLGYSADDAVHLVSEARGVPVPDTEEQLQFIRAYIAGV